MSKQTLIILIILVTLGGAGIWFFYFQSSGPTPATDAEIGASDAGNVSSDPDVQKIERELADLRRLKDLQLDTSILKNPFLQSLEAFPVQNAGTTTPGRPNPFLPF